MAGLIGRLWPWKTGPSKHAHQLEILFADSHAEVDENDPVRHTAFRLLACRECRHVEVFPKENFALCTPRYQAALRQKLTELNWRLQ